MGIIPADAGLTYNVYELSRRTWGHPRGCGAHVASVYDVARPTGSSPRMRGSPLLAEERASSAGGIPADAGLTRQKGQRAAQNWGHPRGCGAHPKSKKEKESDPGSSPRMRASLSRGITCMPRSGVIPAGAGLTVERAQGGIRAWDHPRGCGAHQKAETIKSTVQGSSPRVRGSLKQYFRFRSFLGIIPAGAGLTLIAPTS